MCIYIYIYKRGLKSAKGEIKQDGICTYIYKRGLKRAKGEIKQDGGQDGVCYLEETLW